MPKITYMSIEQAEEEIRQHEVTERIRRFATSDPEVAKQREAEGWGKSKPREAYGLVPWKNHYVPSIKRNA